MKTIFLIISMLILAGCSASGERFKGFEPTAENQSTLYIYRPSKFFQGGTWPTVFIDGKERFSLKNGGYVFTHLIPGNHDIKIGATSFFDNWIFKDISAVINIEKGKAYYLRFDIESEGATIIGSAIALSGAAGLIKVSKAQAELDLKALKSSM